MPKNQMNVCATCLSFSNFEFPMSEDIKGILRSLLYDCGFDEFIQAIPPDEQLTLCNTCNQTLRDMHFFRERAQNSFNEFKKFWCVHMHKPSTKHTVAVPSNSQTETISPCDEIKIEDVKELKCEEPDPLETTKPDPESITNIYDSLTDIKDEIDLNTLNQPELNTATNNSVAPRNYNINQNYVNNNAAPSNDVYSHVTTSNNKNVHHEIGSVVLNNAAIIDNGVSNFINKQIAPMTVGSLNNNFVNHNVAIIPILNNMLPARSNKIFNNKFVAMPINPKFCQTYVRIAPRLRMPCNVAQKNNCNFLLGTGNSNINNAAANSNDLLEKTIQSSQHIKSADTIPVANDIATLNYVNSNVTHNSQRNNAVATTNSMYQHKNIFKSVSIDNGQVVLGSDNKKMKIVNTNIRDNIENVGQGIMLNPMPVSKDSCESTTGKGQKKWYIKIVTKEEILKKMEESRNHPDFLEAPHKCVSCVALFPDESLAATHKQECHTEDSDFTCFACSRTFKQFRVLRAHYHMHLIGMCVYRCITCEFETRNFEYIKCHICPNAGSKRLPPKDRNMRLSKLRCLYYCHKCEYVTARSSILNMHCDTKHEKNYPRKVKCDDCGQFYASKYGLKIHIKLMHTGKKPKEEPLYCNLCKKWFSTKITHYTHMRNIHTPQEERKFQCDECKKKFISARQLENHKELHEIRKGGVKNYKCDVCGNAYYTKKVLRRHIAVHHGNKPSSRNHVCEVCGMAFFTKMILKHHMARHSDARPYKCNVCGDTFKYNGALYTHTKLKHKKKKKNSEEPPRKKKNLEKPSKKKKSPIKKRNSEKSPEKEMKSK